MISNKYMSNGHPEGGYMGEEDEQPQQQQQLMPGEQNGGVERLPVSIAELNIKPYKCLKCGFRSDRKSDTLRHIRVKHSVDTLHAFKFLRIMSIKEASETIEEYESTRLFRKSTPRVVSRDFALINSIVQQNNTSTSQSPKPPPFVNNSLVGSPNTRAASFMAQGSSPLTRVVPNGNGLKLPLIQASKPFVNSAVVKTTTSKQAPLASLDYFRCPICLFKHRSRLVMKKHLANHYYTNDLKQTPVYGCNMCSFKASWQFTVKKHILSTHVANPNAFVVKLNQQQSNRTNKPAQIRNKLKVSVNF